ncbi:Spy/CpxP family protein refolding chaperone [Methylocapsa acidiphila]|uniref:Spy/CpxP family protein refolding chaperone n=1 Tax=Methylocapsa acidiphila TaxID=133552 RepID=UPI0006868525|nr:Spy/CpxP family protein refolding chaperone [Methylocapsa acidiphila]
MTSSNIEIRRMSLAVALAALVSAGAVGAARAQQGMPGMEGGAMPMGHDQMMGHEGMMGHGGMMGHEGGPDGAMGGGGMMCHMGEHVEGRIAFLKAELKITEAQSPQWTAFADTFRGDAKKMADMCMTMKEHGSAHMSADYPDRLAMMEQHLTMRLDALRTLKAAAQPLFSVLTDEQKKAANKLLHGPMGMM